MAFGVKSAEVGTLLYVENFDFIQAKQLAIRSCYFASVQIRHGPIVNNMP
jgi:hypothetical protein